MFLLEKLFIDGLSAVLMTGVFAMAAMTVAQADGGPVPEAKSSGKPSHKQDVTFLREEEKLARDVYLTLHKRWGLQIFENISQAEQRHLDRMGMLVRRYGLEDPVTDDTVGAFTNVELRGLYTQLVKRGSTSEIDALRVGASIEELDIRDIRLMRKHTSDPDALDAFAKLECGSRNHLRAFLRQLTARGVTFVPAYLSQDAVDAIVAGPHERCGQGGGKGRGGQGRGGQGRGGQGRGGQGRGGGPGWRR